MRESTTSRLDLGRDEADQPARPDEPDEREGLADLFRELHSSPAGLSSREADRRLLVHGANALSRRAGRRWPALVLAQLTQPLALLLIVAAGLAVLGGTLPLAAAVLAVVILNAAFALVQELQAERAVEALTAYLPATARVRRDGAMREVAAETLVPGDVLEVAEGDCVCADGRILTGDLRMDLSALTGESVAVRRSAEPERPRSAQLTEAADVVFSGTSCTQGRAEVLVVGPECTPNWAGSPRWPRAAATGRAHWNSRSAAPRG